jgi:hypothetical protein
MTSVAVLPELDPATYRRHPLHGEEGAWVQKNCYIDVWIELVHALGLDPVAMLPVVLAIDFEGDQWTFFKPSHDELRELYGLEVQELNVWRPLLDHALTHLAEGRLISTEADAFWLPDTQGTDYRRQHTKTTIVIQSVDVEAHRLGYFHNASYHALDGEDFEKTFRVGLPADPTFMPLFAELVRIDRVVRRPRGELVARSRELLRKHVARRPSTNPVVRFGQRLARDLPWIQTNGLPFYHAWAFATLRQLGAAFELASQHAQWLAGLEPADTAFEAISTGAKTLTLKVARAVNGRRPFDASILLDEMAAAWQRGMDILVTRLES